MNSVAKNVANINIEIEDINISSFLVFLNMMELTKGGGYTIDISQDLISAQVSLPSAEGGIKLDRSHMKFVTIQTNSIFGDNFKYPPDLIDNQEFVCFAIVEYKKFKIVLEIIKNSIKDNEKVRGNLTLVWSNRYSMWHVSAFKFVTTSHEMSFKSRDWDIFELDDVYVSRKKYLGIKSLRSNNTISFDFMANTIKDIKKLAATDSSAYVRLDVSKFPKEIFFRSEDKKSWNIKYDGNIVVNESVAWEKIIIALPKKYLDSYEDISCKAYITRLENLQYILQLVVNENHEYTTALGEFEK